MDPYGDLSHVAIENSPCLLIFSNCKIAIFLIALLNCQRIIGLHAGSTSAWDVPRYKSVCMNWDTHSKYLVGGLEHFLFSISYMG